MIYSLFIRSHFNWHSILKIFTNNSRCSIFRVFRYAGSELPLQQPHTLTLTHALTLALIQALAPTLVESIIYSLSHGRIGTNFLRTKQSEAKF